MSSSGVIPVGVGSLDRQQLKMKTKSFRKFSSSTANGNGVSWANFPFSFFVFFSTCHSLVAPNSACKQRTGWEFWVSTNQKRKSARLVRQMLCDRLETFSGNHEHRRLLKVDWRKAALHPHSVAHWYTCSVVRSKKLFLLFQLHLLQISSQIF